MASEQIQRRLAAILSGDVVGASRLMAGDEDTMVRSFTTYREEIGVLIRQHRGRVVDAPGDNLQRHLRALRAAWVGGSTPFSRDLK